MRRIYISDLTHLHMWRDSFTCVTWLVYICDVIQWYVMTRLHMWRDSFTYVTWLFNIRDVTHLHMWHDSVTYVTWLVYICDVIHSHMWRDSFTDVTWLSDTHVATRLHRWGDSFTYSGTPGTGWRRLIGSPKLQIIFHKRATKYRSLLRKMTYKDILWVFATL